MNIDVAEWLNLALRWLHLTTGIAWIGSSFYFVWLDNHLTPPKTGDASGELWSVHGGGFYHNQKYQVAPAQMPDHLHWFKWEAYFTWISGFSLLVLIYYFGAQNYLIDPAKAKLSTGEAVGISLASIIGAWVFYDLLCRSRQGRNNLALGIIWFSFLAFAAAFLNDVFNAKAVYIQIGAMIGTVMVANVFLVIIPNQRRVVADLVAGRTPDPKLGQQAKQRSVHNSYMTLPVLFIMISQHYPMTYGAERPSLVLGLLGLTGVAIRQAFNLRHRGKSSPLLYGLIVLLALTSVTYVSAEKARLGEGQVDAAQAKEVTYATVAPIFMQRCSSCHSAKPSNPAFAEPPLGLVLDTYDQVRVAAPKIKQRAVDTDTMPPGNMTGMTMAERQTIGRWIAAGTPE